ncbi:MAG: type II secretion system protein [Planctomycetes bacterium]|jgi:type II secretion system protein I|nr:type II secretion system protein [Planctomycetota bacterium]
MSIARGYPGFTLLEILIALCVVLLALVPLIHLHVISIRTVDSSFHRVRATVLAQNRLAEIVAQEVPELGTTGGRIEDANDGMVYRWQAVVTEARPPETESVSLIGLRGVHVEVAWQDGGRDGMVTLDTFIRAAHVTAGQMRIDEEGPQSGPQTAAPVRSPL